MTNLQAAFTLRIESALAVVLRVGFTGVIPTRFPFTYHHDLVRTVFAGSRSDVAQRSHALEKEYGREAYEAAMLLGAVLYLAREQPMVFTRAVITDDEFRALVTELVVALHPVPDSALGFEVV